MSKKEIRVLWMPEPNPVHSIVIQGSQEQIINRLNFSFKQKPLNFPKGIDSEQWVFLEVKKNIDKDEQKRNLLEFKIGKLIEQPGNESVSFSTLETIELADIGKDQACFFIPKFDFDNEEIYKIFVRRLTELWPEAKRQCSEYLGIPLGGTFQKVYQCYIELTPQELVRICYSSFFGVDDTIEYEFGEAKLPVKTTLYPINFPPDDEYPIWEFFVVAKDTIPLDDEAGYERILVRGLTNMAIKVEIHKKIKTTCDVLVYKNIDLPLPAFYPGKGPQKPMREPYPYDKVLNGFITKLQRNFEQSKPEKSKQERRREKENLVYEQRAREFKRIKEEHPEYSQERVAMAYNDWLFEKTKNGEVIEFDREATADTVSNIFKKKGWKWVRGDRIR
jgi:hypothetical protein